MKIIAPKKETVAENNQWKRDFPMKRLGRMENIFIVQRLHNDIVLHPRDVRRFIIIAIYTQY